MSGTAAGTSRAGHRRPAPAAMALLLLAGVLGAGCGDDDKAGDGAAVNPAPAEAAAEPAAGRWRTWVLSSGAEVKVPPPPAPGSAKAKADLAEVKRLAGNPTDAAEKTVAKWNGPLPTSQWTKTALDFVSHVSKNPPLSSRNYALVHVAMYDAAVASWHWKYAYEVEPPEGVDTLVPAGAEFSYPSEHAAMAGAASTVLAALYPNESALRLEEMAEEAATSRVQAGTNTPSDVAAGLDLGRAVGEKVIAYAKTDGADQKWDGKRPPGIGGGPRFWEPPPGSVSPPIEPMAGSWKPWVMTSGSQFRPGPPPAFGTPEFRAAAQEIVDIQKNLTPEQEKIARFWEGAEGTSLPAGIVISEAEKDIAAAKLSLPRVARALALLNIAMADGGIAAWDAKFTYWNPRPENAIRDLGLDRDWKPLLPTPRFPAYPSGSAGYAGGAETILTYLFPDKAEDFRRRSDDQTISRLYAGIHWRYDAVSREAGRKIAELVIERAKKDGADG
ncbi:MAG TPA: vanadium-dependent haloperoxidase [Acidimicrobiales bacterium]|nr:vanadium-dependent haloperoxidase [Acidimicrobiales bacterium]